MNISEQDPLPKTGAFVVDMSRDEIGQVMDYDPEQACLQLRPPRGGREWDARPDDVRPATDKERLSAKVQSASSGRWWA
ncbi:hypothetical protein LKL35_11185 [Streptomyces sp. ET3-23]|uniref:hypothetical protein n=1 Tax=Streptomyces sp. ET3-23 TaxID=2885643 RepID=UPI001D0F7C0A|nr:hypothetical protein [Streptomyces sp. ET3-23]MCC2275977.1 hypothetical protein [Streptomyces sp. ET3-23]